MFPFFHPEHSVNPHLPIMESSNCFTSPQSCSSFSWGSSLGSAEKLGPGFGRVYPGHRRDGKKHSLSQRRFLHGPGCFLEHVPTLNICLLPSQSWLPHQEPLTSHFTFVLFSFSNTRTKPKWGGGRSYFYQLKAILLQSMEGEQINCGMKSMHWMSSTSILRLELRRWGPEPEVNLPKVLAFQNWETRSYWLPSEERVRVRKLLTGIISVRDIQIKMATELGWQWAKDHGFIFVSTEV